MHKWEVDQIEALDIYKRDLKNHDFMSKKEIFILQNNLEIIYKEYKQAKENFKIQNINCLKSKIKIEELIESKTAYENVYNILKKEIDAMALFKTGEKKPAKKSLQIFSK